MTAARPPIEELRQGKYMTSSYTSEQVNCVSVTRVGSWIGIQDDKEYAATSPADRTTLGYTIEEFAAFIAGAKAGEFDHLLT